MPAISAAMALATALASGSVLTCSTLVATTSNRRCSVALPFPPLPAWRVDKSLRQDGRAVQSDHGLARARRPPDERRAIEPTVHHGTLIGMKEDHPLFDRRRAQAAELRQREQRRQSGQGAPFNDGVAEPPVLTCLVAPAPP